MAQARRDDNRVPTLLGVDSALFETPTTAAVDPITHEVLTKPSLPTGAATSAKQLADNHQVQVSNIASTPVITGFATSAKQLPDGHSVALSSTDNTVLDNIVTQLQVINSLVPLVYDYISLSYTGSDLTGVIFKTGGSGGTTVATLTLAYTDGNLVSVTKI